MAWLWLGFCKDKKPKRRRFFLIISALGSFCFIFVFCSLFSVHSFLYILLFSLSLILNEEGLLRCVALRCVLLCVLFSDKVC